ncbi:MAG: presqualene diphosphate synthase HpnD [Bdellovibrionales bacterium]
MTPLSYTEAIHQVKKQVSASRSSFHAGMAVLPKNRREAMYALYGFCRVVDDIADESLSPEVAASKLQEWRVRISDMFRGKTSDAVTTALLPSLRAYDLVEKDFQEIIDGMEMDSMTIVAPSLATLDVYCDRVASAVGRISIRIFGDAGTDAMKVAYHLGRALQLTNILRDLSEDAARKRLYLPCELLEKHSISSRNPSEVLQFLQLPLVCRDLASIARTHYTQADIYMKKCPASAMRPARIMRDYYGAILGLLLKENWRDLSFRVTIPKWKKIFIYIKDILL